MASSQLKPAASSFPEGSSGSNSGAAFPFAWRVPAVQGSETVITTLRSEANALPAETSDHSHPDQSRRLFPTTTDVDDVTGVRVAHFTIQHRIGVGGMGSVFLATDEQLRRNVALKILAPSLSLDPSSVKRFQNEARAAARLDHDNIARVFFYGDDAGLHYIAYEFVPGSNLRDVIRLKGRLDPAEAVNYAIQLAAALNHTAAAGVVHRDIKPSNILITPQGRAKLVDLGLARRDSVETSAELTVAGTTLGTFDYISPEQAKDPRNVDVRSDIYSLGCTLYHMLTGEPPYPEGTVLQKLLDHQGKEAPDPARKNRRVSPALSAVVRRMMAADPRRRYAGAGELLRDLLHVARTLGSGAVPIDGQVWLTATRHEQPYWLRNVGWIATAATLILVVVLMEQYPQLTRRFDPRITSSPIPRNVGGIAKPPANSLSPSASGSTAGDIEKSLPISETNAASKSGTGQGEIISGVTQGPSLPDDGTESASAPLRAIPLNPKLPDGMFETADLQLLSGQTNARFNGTESTGTSKATTSPGATREDLPVPITNVKPPTDDTSATTSDSQHVVSVLDGKSYETLEAACAEIKDGGIIELRYTGRRSDAERPIRLSNKKNIIIRSGVGFRPLIEFAPSEPPSDAAQSRMFTVSGGSLELVNVDISFVVPERLTADRWALFSLERPEKLQLHGVTITIANLNSQPACVIEQLAAPGQGLGNVGMMKNGMPAEPPKVSIAESLVRGECDFYLLRDAVPSRLQIKDALIALRGSLFHSICQSELPNTESDRVILEFDHSTCLLSDSLIVTEGVDSPTDRTPQMLVIARNNIFSCGSGRPLIVMKDADDLMDMQQRFSWNGDRNFYDAPDVFWQLGGRQSLTSARQLDFTAWRNYWGNNEGAGSTNAPVIWKSQLSNRAWTKFVTDNAALDQAATFNPAVNGASDGKDAGATLGKLPMLPADKSISSSTGALEEQID